MLCALIMAGGKGERFWPLSTDSKPKQFLELLGNESMIQMTVNRLLKIMPIERIFVVTAKDYTELVKKHLPNLPERNIIIEPVGKNTAPCIALSAFVIDKYYKNATIAVIPSDQQVCNDSEFANTIEAAYEFVEMNSDSIVTIGIRPDRPETGYGYIQYDEAVEIINNYKIIKVNRFVEKPNTDKAKKYIFEGNYVWNAGMFVWKTSTILKYTKNYLRSTFDILQEIALSAEDCFDKILDEKYKNIDGISVDYGIMEHADNIYVIPSEFGWDDIGSWNAIERYRKKDENNNIVLGKVEYMNCKDNIVFGKSKPIIAVGIENMFVVESDDVILICKKDEINNIKEIKEKFLNTNL